MALQDKYKTLIDTAKSAGVSNLQVREQNGVLYIDGDAPAIGGISTSSKYFSSDSQSGPQRMIVFEF